MANSFDLACGVLRCDDMMVASSPQSGCTRMKNLIVGHGLPQTNLDVCSSPMGSGDFSGSVFIRGYDSGTDVAPYALAVNLPGTNPQFLISNVALDPAVLFELNTYTGHTPAEFPICASFYMAPETSGYMNIAVKGTSMTPYLELGDIRCPVKVESTLRGDTSGGALIVNGGILANGPSCIHRPIVDYGTVLDGVEYALCIRNLGYWNTTASYINSGGHYPAILVTNSSSSVTAWSTTPHLNVMWYDVDSSSKTTNTLIFEVYGGLHNSVITIASNGGTTTSTDPSSPNYYNARVYLPSPMNFVSAYTGAALGVWGGMYVGKTLFCNSLAYGSWVRFGAASTADALTSYESRTLATAWTFGTNAYAQAVSYQKLGKLVTLTPTAVMDDAIVDASTDLSLEVVLNAQLPASCRPASNVVGVCGILCGETITHAIANVDTNGTVKLTNLNATAATRVLCTPFSFLSAS